ncbi:MAG TPA: hypothetical protein VH207_03575 [Chthoniobacterales bacterium]|jgi:hypothetical protein|nr:hypothetical protein [Chthoniobacterales bacterium]
MAKSSKKSKAAGLTENKPAAAEPEAQTGNGTAKPEKPAVAKSAAGKPAKATAKAVGKSRSTTPRKSTAPRKPRASKAANSKTSEFALSDDNVRMRAYFISERRQQQGLPGDSAHDWLEALRQLQEEAGARV